MRICILRAACFVIYSSYSSMILFNSEIFVVLLLWLRHLLVTLLTAIVFNCIACVLPASDTTVNFVPSWDICTRVSDNLPKAACLGMSFLQKSGRLWALVSMGYEIICKTYFWFWEWESRSSFEWQNCASDSWYGQITASRLPGVRHLLGSDGHDWCVAFKVL